MGEPTCPGCGAEEYVRSDAGEQYECVEYECGTRHWPNAARPMLHRNECYTRQLETARAALAQRDERIRELEEQLHLPCVICGLAHSPGRYNGPEGSGWAECYERRRAERLDAEIVCVALNNHADLATVAPVVRAAMEQVTARDAWTALIDSAASATYYDACETTEGAARALPADVRERLGVPDA